MLEYVEGKHKDILSEIKAQGDISPELDEKMRAALKAFAEIFQPAA